MSGENMLLKQVVDSEGVSPYLQLQRDITSFNIVKDRTKNEAAWMGGCLLPGCVEPNTCSALSIPDGVNIQLFSQPNFMGYTRSFQGPQEIPCLVNYGWNDRIQSVKVQNSIGLDAEEHAGMDSSCSSLQWLQPGWIGRRQSPARSDDAQADRRGLQPQRQIALPITADRGLAQW